MGSEIKQYIETCDFCRAYDKRQPKETLISHEVPERPWAKVGIYLFSYRSQLAQTIGANVLKENSEVLQHKHIGAQFKLDIAVQAVYWLYSVVIKIC